MLVAQKKTVMIFGVLRGYEPSRGADKISTDKDLEKLVVTQRPKAHNLNDPLFSSF